MQVMSDSARLTDDMHVLFWGLGSDFWKGLLSAGESTRVLGPGFRVQGLGFRVHLEECPLRAKVL
jgi:hypothetical protein